MTDDNGDQPDEQVTAREQLKQQRLLHRIDRSRSRLMVCFYTLPLYIIALELLLNEGRSVTTFMFVYMAVYAVFAVDMVVRVCPRCGEQFFVNAFFLNFFTRRCVHCGLSCRRPHDQESSTDGRRF
ncbi:MAG: hypothetical protein KJN90_11410 [Gammaproteobacteria bacterium]|nr:hypothetical protein [Gammaproteobacteria bacterium]